MLYTSRMYRGFELTHCEEGVALYISPLTELKYFGGWIAAEEYIDQLLDTN